MASQKSSHQRASERIREKGSRPPAAAAGSPLSPPGGLLTGGWAQRAMFQAAWIPLLLAVGLGFFYVGLFGVNVPWCDEWEGSLPVLQHQAEGTLTFSELWTQHSEHRIFFPQLIMLGLGLLSHGNLVLNMYVSVLLLAVALALFVYVFVKACPARAALWLAVPIALLMTSWRQSDNLLWGFQVTFVLVVVASLGAFFFLHLIGPDRWRAPLAAAAGAATVAVFSSAQGLLVWPVGLLQLLLLPLSRRLKFGLLFFWAAFGAAELLLYFHGYIKPDYHPDYTFSWSFFLAAVGCAVVQDEYPAKLLGGLFLLLAALAVGLVVVRRQWGRYSFWLAACLFSLLTAAMLTVGRGGFGIVWGMPTRYATMASPLVVGVYALLVLQAQERVSPRLWGLAGFLVGIIALCVFQSDMAECSPGVQMPEQGRQSYEMRNYEAFVMSTLDDQPEESMRVFVNASPEGVRRGVAFLKKQHYGLFAPGGDSERYAPLNPALPTLSETTKYNLDGFKALDKGAGYAVSGWAIDALHQAPAGGVFLVLDGREYPVYYGVPRPDVAKGLQNEGLLHCGFQRLLPAKDLTPGRHQVGFKILTDDRQALWTVPSFSVDIK